MFVGLTHTSPVRVSPVHQNRTGREGVPSAGHTITVILLHMISSALQSLVVMRQKSRTLGGGLVFCVCCFDKNQSFFPQHFEDFTVLFPAGGCAEVHSRPTDEEVWH